jgi:hypothetical protein
VRRLSAWIGVHWFVFVALFGVLLIAISGLIGSFYGVPALFRDDPEWTAANGFLARLAIGSVRLGQTACVLFIGLCCALALFLEEWREDLPATPSLRATLRALAPPVALLGILPLLAFAVPNESILYTPNEAPPQTDEACGGCGSGRRLMTSFW